MADEIINEKKDVGVVLLYHPYVAALCLHQICAHKSLSPCRIIFRGLKSLSLSNTQQRTVLRLIAEGVSVYCTHTALDSAVGGINDYVACCALGTGAKGVENVAADRSITPIEEAKVPERSGAGVGRVIRAPEGLPSVSELAARMSDMVKHSVTGEEELAGVNGIGEHDAERTTMCASR